MGCPHRPDSPLPAPCDDNSVFRVDDTSRGVAGLRSLATAKGFVAAGAVVALAFWSTPRGYGWLGWPLLAALIAVSVVLDLAAQRHRKAALTLSVGLADATTAASALAAGLLLTAGGWISVAGVVLVPVVQCCWFLRARALRGHWDAPLALTLLLAAVASASAERPWSPSSAQSAAVTTTAAGCAVLGVWATLQAKSRRAGLPMNGGTAGPPASR